MLHVLVAAVPGYFLNGFLVLQEQPFGFLHPELMQVTKNGAAEQGFEAFFELELVEPYQAREFPQ